MKYSPRHVLIKPDPPCQEGCACVCVCVRAHLVFMLRKGRRKKKDIESRSDRVCRALESRLSERNVVFCNG